jgi:hypothetical protein
MDGVTVDVDETLIVDVVVDVADWLMDGVTLEVDETLMVGVVVDVPD